MFWNRSGPQQPLPYVHTTIPSSVWYVLYSREYSYHLVISLSRPRAQARHTPLHTANSSTMKTVLASRTIEIPDGGKAASFRSSSNIRFVFVLIPSFV